MSRNYSTAILFHLDDWDASTASIPIAPGISLNRFEGSKVEKLYHALCEEGHDDGEPYLYRSFVRFDSDETRNFPLNFGDPYSHVDRFCNLFALRQKHPIRLARIIASSDDFATSDLSETLFLQGGRTDLLEKDDARITDNAISDIRTAWLTIDDIWRDYEPAGRISNALTFFYYSWRAHHLEQVCLNLVVALECLFAPHLSGETTHQIAFSVARFAGKDRTEREHLFGFIKQLYSVRSAIVHGGQADKDKIIALVPTGFDLVSALLLKILTTPDLAYIFGNETERRHLLRQFLFDQEDFEPGHENGAPKGLCCLVNPVDASCLVCRQKGYCERHLAPCRISTSAKTPSDRC